MTSPASAHRYPLAHVHDVVVCVDASQEHVARCHRRPGNGPDPAVHVHRSLGSRSGCATGTWV